LSGGFVNSDERTSTIGESITTLGELGGSHAETDPEGSDYRVAEHGNPIVTFRSGDAQGGMGKRVGDNRA